MEDKKDKFMMVEKKKFQRLIDFSRIIYQLFPPLMEVAKAEFIFSHWEKDGIPLYKTDGILDDELSSGSVHSGSTFNGYFAFTKQEKQDTDEYFTLANDKGCIPVFAIQFQFDNKKGEEVKNEKREE